MKRIFMVLVVSTATLANAQLGLSFGVKGNAVLRASSSGWEANDSSKLSGVKDRGGFNFGVFSKIKLPIPIVPLFLMPELYFTHYGSEATYKTSMEIGKIGDLLPPRDVDVKLSANSFRVDIPILIGYDVMGIGGIFMGPVFHNQLRTLNKGVAKFQTVQEATDGDISNIDDIKEKAKKLSGDYEEKYVSEKKTSVGYQIGISIDFIPKLTINARYEVGKKDAREYVRGEDVVRYTDKPKFFIVGAGFKF